MIDLVMRMLHQNCGEPRVHPNGFIQLDLGADTRLHIWGDERIPKQRVDTQIHDHVFGFNSYVLYGIIRNTMFRRVDRTGGAYQPHIIVGQNLADTRLEAHGSRCDLETLGVQTYFHGQTYSLHRGEIHKSTPFGRVATVIFRDGPTFTGSLAGVSPTVFVPVGAKPDGDFNRLTHDQALLWQIIEETLAPLVRQIPSHPWA